MSSLDAASGDRVAPGVVHFIPDSDNRRGAITCLAVGSQEDGKRVLSVFPFYFGYSTIYMYSAATGLYASLCFTRGIW